MSSGFVTVSAASQSVAPTTSNGYSSASVSSAMSAPSAATDGVDTAGRTGALLVFTCASSQTCTVTPYACLAGVWGQCIDSSGSPISWTLLATGAISLSAGGADRVYFRITDITSGSVTVRVRAFGP
jgi:hypothetical protein